MKNNVDANQADDGGERSGSLLSSGYIDFEARALLLDDVLSSLDEVVWIRRACDMVLTYVNKACENVYECSPKELIGTKGVLFDNIHPDDKEKLRHEIEHTLREGKGSMEYRIYNRKGELRHISGQGYVKRDSSGRAAFICGVSRDVTDLRSVECSLREKIDELENVFESITDNFIALDKEFRFMFANTAALKLYGKTKEELLGQPIFDIFPQGRLLKFYPGLKRAIDEQVPVQFEEFSPTVGKWILVNAYPTKGGVAVYFRDISEQRNMQEALRNNEYSLRALINNTADFIWSVDRDFRIIQVNQPFVDFVHSFTGKVLRPGDSIMSDDFGPAMRQKWEGYFSRALSGQTFLVIDEETIGATQHHREKRFKPIFAEDGEVIGVSVFARDISEQARLHAKILNEERKLRAIINNTKDIIWLINDHMETISANQAYYDRVASITGNKKYEELTTADFEKDELERWQNYYRRALDGEAFTLIDERTVAGKKVYEEVHFTPIHNKDNKVVSVNCMSRDITIEKEHLMRVQQQNQMLNEIASMQSHQVRGPIATILGLTQLINHNDPSDPTNRSALEGIKEVASDLDKLIKDIVAKTNAAKM